MSMAAPFFLKAHTGVAGMGLTSAGLEISLGAGSNSLDGLAAS